jgi:8-oxo-dGTP pyrophosphatase MutT (NUDIX family)
MDGRSPARAAAQEAYEEAGLKGRVSEICLGVYDYRKSLDKKRPYLTIVYPMRVKEELTKWPEKKQRKRKWFSRNKAATKVLEPALKAMILAFDPQPPKGE